MKGGNPMTEKTNSSKSAVIMTEEEISQRLQEFSETAMGRQILYRKNILINANIDSLDTVEQLDELLSQYYFLAIQYIYQQMRS